VIGLTIIAFDAPMKRAIGIASLGWARSSRCIASMFLSKMRLRSSPE